jgi:acetyltransferase-like isoleucine patch superfamily enzyme
MRGPILKRGVQIGVNVTLTPGASHRRIFGHRPGAVVTKDVPSGPVGGGQTAVSSNAPLRCDVQNGRRGKEGFG